MRVALSLLVAAALALGACGDDTVSGPAPPAPQRLKLSSVAFRDGEPIPSRYTCDGQGASPPLAWSGVPRAAKELALLMEDPDAPNGTFVHWTAWGIDPSTKGLPEGADGGVLTVGKNSFGDARYGGPCPPEGDDPHRYVFTVYALSGPLGLEEAAGPDDVREAIGKIALAKGTLTGTYGRR